MKGDSESWAFLDGVQVVGKDGRPLLWNTPAVRAVGQKGQRQISPKKFNHRRSTELQAYADAVIETILAAVRVVDSDV